ncbi:premnaspirodiene oxygenase-like [Phalaenopsis equestris]|uniref:premnaspirodiene oxygenase-like n=1 Tax=Phalaenopsis equestris TaxID=78828 RepID=UPI0009E28716|nr:premnaspirodiene oxygenase-like [Phalaenopsis equestris]
MEVLHILSSFLILFLILKFKNSKRRLEGGWREAPGPWNLPIIGSLHLVVGRHPPHQSFRNLSAVYGPIMSLKLGDIKVVIISSAEAAREIMKTHDIDFASRPVNESVEAIFYGSNNMVFGPCNEFWRQMRRLCSMELLSIRRVRSFRAVREDEVSHLIRHIAASSGVVVNLSSKMAETSNNIMARASIGGRCDDQKLFLSALSDAVEILSGFTIVDLFPSIPFIRRITGYLKGLEQCGKKLDTMAEKIVEEHKEKWAKHVSNNDNGQLMEEDLTDVLLRVQREDSLQFPITNDNIKALINDMLMAGSETTSTTLEWAMSEMVQNPTIMEKAQREVREVIGNSGGLENLADEKLISGRLTYLQLVIKETLRLHPPGPLLLPRENQESQVIMGYVIPAKTKVMINMWAIGREEKYWGDPESFRPERFEENHVDFKGAHFEYVPFGAGKRICPGMQFALSTLEIILAHLLYYFDWKFLGEKGEKLDMTEAFGITARKKAPLVLLPTLRFPIKSASV